MNCSIDGCGFETEDQKAIAEHAAKHKRQYRRVTGRDPESYDDVRAELAGLVGPLGDLRSGVRPSHDRAVPPDLRAAARAARVSDVASIDDRAAAGDEPGDAAEGTSVDVDWSVATDGGGRGSERT